MPEPPQYTAGKSIPSAADSLAVGEAVEAVDAAPGEAAVGRRSRRPVAIIAALLAVVLIAAVAALSLGGGGSSVQSAHSGALAVSYSSPWTPTGASSVTAPLAAPSLRFVNGASAVELGPLQQSAEIPAGAPPTLVQSHGAPTAQTPGSFGGHPATTYTWGASLAAVVLASSGGDYAAVCTGVGASASCTRFAGRATLSGLTFLTPGTDQPVQAQLASAVALAQLTTAQRSALAATSLAVRKATLLSAAEHARSAAAAAGRVTPPARFAAPVQQLVSALAREGAALTSLARAAKANAPAAFNARRARLRTARVAVQASLTLLRSFGFNLSYAPPLIAAARIPPAPSAAKPSAAAAPVVQHPSTASAAPAPSSSSSSSPIIVQGGSS